MKIVITRTDGGVSVMTLIGDANEADCIEKWMDLHGEQYVSHSVVADDAIPADREQRDSWVLVGDAVVVQ